MHQCISLLPRVQFCVCMWLLQRMYCRYSLEEGALRQPQYLHPQSMVEGKMGVTDFLVYFDLNIYVILHCHMAHPTQEEIRAYFSSSPPLPFAQRQLRFGEEVIRLISQEMAVLLREWRQEEWLTWHVRMNIWWGWFCLSTHWWNVYGPKGERPDEPVCMCRYAGACVWLYIYQSVQYIYGCWYKLFTFHPSLFTDLNVKTHWEKCLSV